MGAQPQPTKQKPCREKRRLSEAMLETATDVLALEAMERTNIANADSGLIHIQRGLQEGRRKCEIVRQTYQAHIREHGC